MKKQPARVHVPKLEDLKTVKQLCTEFPQLFTEGSLRWLIFNADSNGFDRCIIRMGRRLFIDTVALRVWLAEQRDRQGHVPGSVRLGSNRIGSMP